MKPALRAVLAAIGLAFAVAAVHAQDALAREMMQRLKLSNPEAEVRLLDGDQIGVYGKGKEHSVLDLGNLRALCETRPQECEQHKANRIAVTRDLGGGSSFDLGLVRAVVRPVDYVDAVRRQFEKMKAGRTPAEVEKIERSVPLAVPLGPHFVRMWVRDSATGMAPLGRGDLAERRLGPGELDAASARNFDAEQMPPLVQNSRDPALWIAEGNDYISSVLVDPKLWQRVAGSMAREDVSVCIPERDVLVAYFPRLDPRQELDVERLCQVLAGRGVTFSPKLVRRINDNWVFR